MYVIRITTALGRRFFWPRIYQTHDHAFDALLFQIIHVDGDRKQILRLPFTGN